MQLWFVSMLLVGGAATAAEVPQDVAQLRWLAGCWIQEGSEPGTLEQWMAPAGGTMLGVGRTVKGGKTVEYEFMRIERGDDGRVVYVALPAGQKPAIFAAIKLSSTEAVFENLQHDFPQRVIYRQDAANHLAARIEGMRGGVLKSVDYPMQRVRCEPLTQEP